MKLESLNCYRILPLMGSIPAIAISLVFVSGVLAQPIAINNAGCEENTVSAGCFAVFVPIGWEVYDPNGIYDGGADSVGCVHADGSPYYDLGAPEGVNIALVFLSGNVGQGPMGLRQSLPEVLEANTRYVLSAEIGNIRGAVGPPPCDDFGFFDLDGFPGYRLQLLAGGVVVLEDDNSLMGQIDEGQFMPTSVELVVGNTHAQIGEGLEVRLMNLNIPGPPGEPGIEVNFDDVRLERRCVGAGDLDESGVVDMGDLMTLVDVLIGLDEDAMHIERADVDCSGVADGADVAAFVERVLS
ncbi:MAG: hypothetical protein IPK83_00170 [Planctomycetes bacterium]|nr:hypothetical protein [Planctomycetota bacterium]